MDNARTLHRAAGMLSALVALLAFGHSLVTKARIRNKVLTALTLLLVVIAASAGISASNGVNYSMSMSAMRITGYSRY